MHQNHMDEKDMLIQCHFSAMYKHLRGLFYVVYLLIVISLSGCATATADGIISRIRNPVKEMNLDGPNEAQKNEKDINIRGVNYHSFRIDKILKSNASCYILIPYDKPPPRWDTYCWITDNIDNGIEIASKEISWKAYINGTVISIKDTNFQGTKCLAHVKLKWEERSRALYALSYSLYLIALPVDILTFPIQYIFSDQLNPF